MSNQQTDRLTQLGRKRPGLALFERAIRECPGLTAAEVAVLQAFIETPDATIAELAEASGVDDSTVSRVKRSPRFWAVLPKLGLGEAIGGLSDALILQGLLACQSPTVDHSTRQAWAQIGAKRAGTMREGGVAVAVSVAAGADIEASVSRQVERLQRDLGLFSPPDAPANGDTCGKMRVTDSNSEVQP